MAAIPKHTHRINGRAVAGFRTRERLSQRALAELAGCSAGLIALIETRRSDCSDAIRDALAVALHIEVEMITNPIREPEEVA